MTKVKSIFIGFIGMAVVFCFAAMNRAGELPPDRAEVPLTDPGKPGLVKVSVHIGNIIVSGYNGKNIMVEAVADTAWQDKHKEIVMENLKELKKEQPKNTKGMHVIQNNSTGLSIEEENNIVKINTASLSRKVDVIIKVPFKTSLKLKGFLDGEIKVEKVEGELEVTHHNGPITLKDVGGTVVANTFNGGVTVTFDTVNLARPMSFSSFNGDIDVTFPKEAKFNLKLKTEQGEIYSDFKLQMQSNPSAEKKPERKGGKYIVKFDKVLYGLLNGGGEEIQFKTFNGNIYIREKK
jgi:DUF4097 and DUF4098 domain-containing protein YvlB